MQNIAAIIEARMTSSRFPGKVLKPILGHPVLKLMIERVARIPEVTSVIIATTTNPADDPIVELAESLGVHVYRGSEDDVLGRVADAAKAFKVDVIVQITGDCPLVDPAICSKVINIYLEGKYDYVVTDIKTTYPIGLDVHVFSAESLQAIAEVADDPLCREHVTYYYILHPERYRIFNHEAEPDLHYPQWRWVLDYPQDYELIKVIYENLYPKNKNFTAQDIRDLLLANPRYVEINAACNEMYKQHVQKIVGK